MIQGTMLSALMTIGGMLIDKLSDKQIAESQATEANSRAEFIAKMQDLARANDVSSLESEVKTAASIAGTDFEIERPAPSTSNVGWRDTLGNICAYAFGFNTIGIPLINTCANVAGAYGMQIPPVPTPDFEMLGIILAGLLGMGTLSTVQKVKGRV